MFANVCRYVRSFVFVSGLLFGFASPLPLWAFQVEETDPPEVVPIEDCEAECRRIHEENRADIESEHDRLREDIECEFAALIWDVEQLIIGYQNNPNLSAEDKASLIRDAQALIAQMRVEEARAVLDIERQRADKLRLAAEELERCLAGCNSNPGPAPEPIPDPIP